MKPKIGFRFPTFAAYNRMRNMNSKKKKKKKSKKKKKKKKGLNCSKLQSQYEEAVYSLPLTSQKFLVLIYD